MLKSVALAIIAVALLGCAYGLKIPSLGSYGYKSGTFPDATTIPVVETQSVVLDEHVRNASQILCDLRGRAPVVKQATINAISSDLSMVWISSTSTPGALSQDLFAPEMLSKLSVRCDAKAVVVQVNQGVLGPFDVIYASRAVLGSIVQWYFMAWSSRRRHLLRLTVKNRVNQPVSMQYTDFSRYLPAKDVVFFAKLATTITRPISEAIVMRRDGRSGWHIMGPAGDNPSDWGEELSAIKVHGRPLSIPALEPAPEQPDPRPAEIPETEEAPATTTAEGISFADGCDVRERPRSSSKKIGQAEAGVAYPLLERRGRRWRRIRLSDGVEGWTSCRGEAARAEVPAAVTKSKREGFWYKAKGATRKGPVSAEEIRSLFRSNSIDGETWIWWKGQAQWVRLRSASRFADIQQALAAAEAQAQAAAPAAEGAPESEASRSAQTTAISQQASTPQPAADAVAAPARPSAAIAAQGRPSGRPWWVVVGSGGALRIRDNISQVKLLQSVGYHFRGGSGGPAIALEAQESLGSDSMILEVGARFAWDIPIGRWLFLSPGALVGFMHRSSETCVTLPTGTDNCFALTLWGGTLQLSFDFKLLLGGRVLVFFRPTLDFMPNTAQTTQDGLTENRVGGTGLRFDVAGGAGVAF